MPQNNLPSSTHLDSTMDPGFAWLEVSDKVHETSAAFLEVEEEPGR